MSSPGSERIKKRIGQGLVGVVKGPQYEALQPGPSVYLEVNRELCEWNLKELRSVYIDNAIKELRREKEKENNGELHKWEKMSEREQEVWALERCKRNVDEKKEWGAVLKVPGVLVRM